MHYFLIFCHSLLSTDRLIKAVFVIGIIPVPLDSYDV